ncbi:unnamed protein product [Linum trigynum]|uniref:Uncharacterized protein n=1 Tax=Linum trigynum TaxID=586398 RepID=A0AAV2G4A1_9ROSI
MDSIFRFLLFNTSFSDSIEAISPNFKPFLLAISRVRKGDFLGSSQQILLPILLLFNLFSSMSSKSANNYPLRFTKQTRLPPLKSRSIEKLLSKLKSVVAIVKLSP